VRDGETGLVAPQRAPRELAATILRVIDDPSGAALLAAAARELIAEEFDVSRQSALLEEVA
jgi:glycosyltransferase involved in cell wall biosynthesis